MRCCISDKVSPSGLCWQFEFLAPHYSCEVNVEKVGIKSSLDDPGKDGDWIEGVFGCVPEDPVGDIHRTVKAEGKEIMCGNCLGFTGPMEHEQLGENGDCFQVNTECPKYLDHGKFVVENQCQ